MSALRRADCMEKQDLSDPQKESKFTLLIRSTCHPCWKLPALHPIRFESFFFVCFSPPFISSSSPFCWLRVVGWTAAGCHSTAPPAVSPKLLQLCCPHPRHVLHLQRGSKNRRRKQGGEWFTASRGPRLGTTSARLRAPMLNVP